MAMSDLPEGFADLVSASPHNARPTLEPKRSIAEAAMRVMKIKPDKAPGKDVPVQASSLNVPGFTDMTSASPRDSFAQPRSQHVIEEAAEPVYRMGIAEAAMKVMRGDNAAFAYDKVVDKKKTKNRQGDQADDDMYGVDDDSTPASKATSEANKMKKFMSECIVSMESFRQYSGLPALTENQDNDPSPSVNKSNKLKAGLPGLEGQSLQDINPESGPADEDEVGDDEYVTLDQSIAMLKKEGIDTDEIWAEFLEQKGLTVEMFCALMDEALDSEDAEEMDALLAVEELFHAALPRLIPEGLADLFKRKPVAPAADPLAAVKAGGAQIRALGQKAVKSANNRGVSLGHLVSAKKLERPGPPQTFEPGKIRQRQRAQTVKLAAVKESIDSADEDMELECDHDGDGPMMPWDKKKAKKSKMESLLGKYTLAEGKATAEADAPRSMKAAAMTKSAKMPAGVKKGKLPVMPVKATGKGRMLQAASNKVKTSLKPKVAKGRK